MKRIEIDEICMSCKGTGLYVGMAERDGFAVVCSTCKGLGCHHFVHEYEDFASRSVSDKIIRVLEANPGIMLGLGKFGLTKESFGGMDYADWIAGKPFPPSSEMRSYTCPAWWYQCTNYEKKPGWHECRGNLGRSFSQCEYFRTKNSCWQRFDKEQELKAIK